MTNREIAEQLTQLADLIELDGGDRFRARAYRRAARVVDYCPEPLADRSDLWFENLTGVGPAIASKIAELVASGRLRKLEDLRRSISPGLLEVAGVRGVGPHRARELHVRLGVEDLETLARALDEQTVRGIPGFGARVEQRIAEGLARRRAVSGALNLSEARRAILPMLERIRRERAARQAEVAGDLRRCSDIVTRPVMVIACSRADAPKLAERIALDPAAAEVLERTADRLTVRMAGDVALAVRLVRSETFGAALLHHTGSERHVARLEVHARNRGLVLAEDGLFQDGRRTAGAAEADVYRALGLAYVEPELREDRGEVEAALSGRLPRLLRIEDVRGDLHSHTTASDGRATIEAMARAARARGYEYLAITDHTKSTTVANGLDETRLLAHLDAIERANERVPGIRLLKSAEVDILADGSLDLPDEVLARLDLRVCSLHSLLRLPREQQTERVVRAMQNRWFNVLGHPTGRIIGHRDPSALDLERVLAVARERGCLVELNAQPTRLDLTPEYCRMAKVLGVQVVVSTDSHSTEGLAQMDVGVAQARRAWLQAEDVANTRSWDELQGLLARAG